MSIHLSYLIAFRYNFSYLCCLTCLLKWFFLVPIVAENMYLSKTFDQIFGEKNRKSAKNCQKSPKIVKNRQKIRGHYLATSLSSNPKLDRRFFPPSFLRFLVLFGDFWCGLVKARQKIIKKSPKIKSKIVKNSTKTQQKSSKIAKNRQNSAMAGARTVLKN